MIGGLVRAATGRPAFRASSTGYDATTPSRRLVGFLGSRTEINSLLISSGDELRGKSHKLVRENQWASAAVDEWTAQAVGAGIKPQSRYLDPAGDREATRKLRKSIHQTWADSTDEMDAAGITDGYGLQALAWRSMVEAGEGFIRVRPRRTSDGLLVGVQFQILEPDHVPLTLNRVLENGNTIRAGIEFNQIGQRVAYWMYPEHPGSIATFTVGANQPKRVPADQVIHFFAPLRPGQLRGEPWLTKVLIKIWNLDQWDDAALEHAKLTKMMLGWTSRRTPDGRDPNWLSSNTAGGEDGSVAETAPEGIEFGEIQSGTIMTGLGQDEELHFYDPPEPGANFAAFTESQLRGVGQGVRSLPYEHVSGDASKSNFSSHRARKLAFQRICEQLQFGFAFQVCRPMWLAWLDAAFLGGALDMPGYDVNPRPYRRVGWRMPKWDWLDPLNEAKAEVLLIDNLLKPRSMSIQERGYDEEDVDETIQADQEREDEMKLRRRTTANTVDAATPADVSRIQNQ